MARAQVTTTPTPAAPVRGKIRPYAVRLREKLDDATALVAKLLSHAAAETGDKGLAGLAAEAQKVRDKWQAPLRNLQCLEGVKSPATKRAIGPQVGVGAVVRIVGSDYERASIQHGPKIAAGPWTVKIVRGSWFVLQNGKAEITATSRMLTQNEEKALQAHKEIEADLSAAGPV